MTADNFTLLDGLLVAFSSVIAMVMLSGRIRKAPFWHATVTPLASIIGSGFLVVVPLLANIAGTEAVWAILIIVLLSFWIGGALRFNIQHEQVITAQMLPGKQTGKSEAVTAQLERLSEVSLAFAYVISITFYIRLMCGFVLTGVDAYTPFNADAMATAILLFIGFFGWLRGLNGLEQLEGFSVTIKLAIIASLLAGLAYYDVQQGYDLAGLATPEGDTWNRLRQLAGMLLIVQGFETSKYLGASYGPSLRIRSMRIAQVLAGIIYITFVALAMPLMAPYATATPNETAIIELSGKVTLVLPILLVIAAAMSQFSAAIADTIGAGGVIEKETTQRISARAGYALISIFAVALLWTTHIFELVALASRAFALYYLLQALLAARLALKVSSGRRRNWQVFSYLVLSVLLLLVVLFAISAEA